MGAGEGRSGLGSPAGAGPSRLPARSPQPRGGGAAELPSYQVTAGFGRCSLARPQPIRERRRCSRAGGLPTRAPSPDTPRSTLTHNHRGSHTSTVPGMPSIAHTHTHNHRDTHSDIHARSQQHAETDTQHRTDPHDLSEHSPRTQH